MKPSSTKLIYVFSVTSNLIGAIFALSILGMAITAATEPLLPAFAQAHAGRRVH